MTWFRTSELLGFREWFVDRRFPEAAQSMYRYGIMYLRSGYIGECRFEDVPAAYGNLLLVRLNNDAMAYLDRQGRAGQGRVVKSYSRH